MGGEGQARRLLALRNSLLRLAMQLGQSLRFLGSLGIVLDEDMTVIDQLRLGHLGRRLIGRFGVLGGHQLHFFGLPAKADRFLQ